MEDTFLTVSKRIYIWNIEKRKQQNFKKRNAHLQLSIGQTMVVKYLE